MSVGVEDPGLGLTCSKSVAQVRGYYQRLLKRINSVLRPLGVEVDHQDRTEVHAAMQSWWGMQQKLGEGTALRQLSQRPKKRKLFASSLKDTLVQHRQRATIRNAAAVQRFEVGCQNPF